jgi:[acyl-carrier-protein] S-malonyltransferase
MERCRRAGAKRAIALEVSGAFHSPLMDGAARGLEEALKGVQVSPSKVPVFANASAAAVTEPDEIRRSLVRQLLSPVRWEESIRAMIASGHHRFVEVGPGKVLTGLVRNIDRAATAISVSGQEDIASLSQGGGA